MKNTLNNVGAFGVYWAVSQAPTSQLCALEGWVDSRKLVPPTIVKLIIGSPLRVKPKNYDTVRMLNSLSCSARLKTRVIAKLYKKVGVPKQPHITMSSPLWDSERDFWHFVMEGDMEKALKLAPCGYDVDALLGTIT